MDRKRQLSVVFATIGIALGAGHLVQSGPGGGGVSAASTTANIDFVSAGAAEAAPVLTAEASATDAVVIAEPVPSEPVSPPKTDAQVAVTPPAQPTTEAVMVPPAPVNDLVVPAAPQTVSVDPQPITPAAPAASISGAGSDLAATPTPAVDAVLPAAVSPETVSTSPIIATPVIATPAPVIDTVEAACPVTMKIAAAPQAMIGVSIVAPCAPDARVVIEHEGLAITGKTDAAGSLFLSLPALAVDASVTAYVAEADGVSESLRIPAMATLRRFGVQWQGKDAFQLHAFENEASYGDEGHLSATDPHTPLTGAPPAGGYVTLLGDAQVTLPMLAEIYTFPAGGTANADVLVEAAVTEATCGRALQGETIMALAGEAHVTALTLAMPDCDGVGDILVLKNLVTDLTIAAAN
jgi:hypothetical protein